jgi:hypothetical protein
LTWPVPRWLLPALIAETFDETNRDVFQLPIAEEQFQVIQVGAVASDRVLTQACEKNLANPKQKLGSLISFPVCLLNKIRSP